MYQPQLSPRYTVCVCRQPLVYGMCLFSRSLQTHPRVLQRERRECHSDTVTAFAGGDKQEVAVALIT